MAEGENVKKSFMKEYNFDLSESFEYACKGLPVTANHILFKAPTSRNMTLISGLKQAFYRSLPKNRPDVSEADKNESDNEITGEDVITLISSSLDVELCNVLVMARELFVEKDIALVDGETKLTKPLIDLIHPDDYEMMVGEYLANFILASALRKMNEK